MDENMVKLNIDKELVSTIMTKQIQAVIASSIGDPEEFITGVVKMALRQKVDENGKVSRYSSDNKCDFLDFLTADTVRKAAKELLEEWLIEKKDVLKEVLKKELDKKSTHNKMIKAFVDTFEKSISYYWNFKADIKFERDERE